MAPDSTFSTVNIAVANYGTNNIGIFFNYGNGTFQDHILYSTIHNSNPPSIVVGDLNNNQSLDIIVANSNHQNIDIFLNY
ncbi:unnamed protein product [Adineta ricciae]|uniref:VCBS repeat-containing protein n=1 Tax=Adineta ricciae TaxID=249248 RepID=A0A815YPH6_ADIRI|nr:unnamed protein product [Adineta ricciae]CAF1572591.1 unnamed protein product [Adineta ricciae]